MSKRSLYHHARAALVAASMLIAAFASAQTPAGKPFLDVGKQAPITILVASTPRRSAACSKRRATRCARARARTT